MANFSLAPIPYKIANRVAFTECGGAIIHLEQSMTRQNFRTRLQKRGKSLWRNHLCSLRPAKLFPTEILVHCSYHKCLTKYYTQVVRTLGQEFHFGLVNCGKSYPRFLEAATTLHHKRVLCLDERSEIEWTKLPSYRATHFVRDPRDLIVSGFYYHQRTQEEWCVRAPYTWEHIIQHPSFEYIETDRAKFPGAQSYQEYLNSLDHERGLILELLWRNGSFKQMARWDYHNPKVLECKYEEIVGNEGEMFRRILEFYQMHPKVVARGIELAAQYSLEPQRKAGNPHIRKGTTAQWRTDFTPALKTLFKQEWNTLLIQLGYERDADW